LDKRISAAFVIMLFMLGTFTAPVSAHFTLGKLKGTYDFRDNDFDPHVAGVIAYVWPGAGPYSAGVPAPGWTPYPGYQSPYPGGNPTGMQTHWYQLDSTYYAPFGAILTSTLKAGTPFNKMKVSGNPTIETKGTWVDGADMTVPPAFEHANKGDLIIAFNATAGFTGKYYGFHIDIPPEFTGIDRKKVVCSYTNNYDMYDVDKEVMENDHAPGWNYISIYADPGFPITFSDSGEWYYIRINDVTAPTIAGRYFFKVYMLDKEYEFIWFGACPVENWPVLLVKGEVDPGIITGTIRYGGWNPALYGYAVELPGRVRAVGIADDPYTFKSTGRPVEARAYFNYSATGHYEIEGVAPGTYDVYASLAGYPEIKIASGVKVLKGQSAHVDGYLTPGVVIHGEVFSKCGTGEVLWKCGTYEALTWAKNQRIKIEIYRSLEDAVATTPASSSTKAISWSPAYQSALALRQFAWPGYAGGALGKDYDGVGPGQAWDVLDSAANFKFQFGDKGLYGAPAEWTGHIPQTYATWTNGIPAGTFHIRAWTHGYLQTQADGFTFAPVTFTVASLEWPGDIYVPFDLFLGSYIVKEFHFHNVPGSLEDNGWDLPDKAKRTAVYLYVQVYDAAKKQYGWAVRKTVPKDLEAADVPPLKAVGVRGLLGRSVYKRSYGIPAGIYVVQGYAAGYLDQHPTTISIGLCGSEVRFSNHLDKGAQFDITVYSTDWEHPSVYKPWSWPGENIYVQTYDAAGKALCRAGSFYDKTPITKLPPPPIPAGLPDVPVYWGMPVLTQTSARNFVTVRGYYGAEARRPTTDRADSSGRFPLAFETGTYSFKAFTYGYVQKKPFTVYVPKGAVADIPIKLVQGANVTFDIIFKRESIIDHLRYDSAVRVRVFDDKGVLVGEALTSDYTKWFANAPNTAAEHAAQLQPVSIYYVNAREYINYIPSCTTRLRGKIAGLPDLYRGGYDPTSGKQQISAFCLYSPDPYFPMDWTGTAAAPGVPAPYGIDAYPNYKGGWTIEVDVVPWYLNEFEAYRVVTGYSTIATETSATFTDLTIYVTRSTGTSTSTVYSGGTTSSDTHTITTTETYVTSYVDPTTTIAYVTATTTTTTSTEEHSYDTTVSSLVTTSTMYVTTEFTTLSTTKSTTSAYTTLAVGPVHTTIYYPPPPGVLTGESPKYIPENHFGPYEQRTKVIIPGAHLGGEASVMFELDLRGLVQGTVYGYTHCGDWRAASWVTILALGADGKEYRWYSFDGAYEMWMTPGTYTLHIIPWTPTIQEGHKVATLPGFAVSEGSALAMNFYLEQSGIPIPEFPVTAIVLASALAASLFILRRRRKQ